MTKRDYAFFEAAKGISKLSDFERIHIGCVVVYKNRIISSGFNSNKTSPLQKRYNSRRFSIDTPHKIHAEIKALSPILKMHDVDWAHLKIYLYRQRADGTLGMSRPCASCMTMLKDYGIKHIYYTTDDGYAEENIF